jgi:hypothetical protein
MFACFEIHTGTVGRSATKRVGCRRFNAVLLLGVKIKLDFLDATFLRVGDRHDRHCWCGIVEIDDGTILQVGNELARGGRDQLERDNVSATTSQFSKEEGFRSSIVVRHQPAEKGKKDSSNLHGGLSRSSRTRFMMRCVMSRRCLNPRVSSPKRNPFRVLRKWSPGQLAEA